MKRRASCVIALLATLLAPPAPRADVVNTVHNLTPSGSGPHTNPGPVGLCTFCHTPHRAGQTLALWNRVMPSEPYQPYDSSTLRAAVGQPTGASRLCLSCHDGTIALGSLLHAPGQVISPLEPLTGRTRLGTDLSDDHPVSFVFDEALAVANGELVSPSTLVGEVQLDRNEELQCTACHDPHEDGVPKFLVMANENGALCVTCHAKRGWTTASHATSNATWTGTGPDPWPESDLSTVAANACLSCHDPHSAASPERLLSRAPEEEVCIACHNGNVARTDVDAQLLKVAHHPVRETSGTHDPAEDPLAMERHSACTDCHNPHAVNSSRVPAPEVGGAQIAVRGLDSSGRPVAEARFAYEVCFKCHGVTEAPSPRVVRHDHVTNVRSEVDAANPSFHPVIAPGTNPNVVTLIPPLHPGSQIACHDCHNTDEAELPMLTTPNGPHGSIHEPILERDYPLVDFVEFDSETYALCFKCHDERALLDEAAFLHDRHLENEDASCAACHDPHGSRTATHLVNFLRFDELGNEVVSPSRNTGLLEFQDLGDERGRCYLSCHGEEHDPKEYIGNDDL